MGWGKQQRCQEGGVLLLFASGEEAGCSISLQDSGDVPQAGGG